MSDNKKSEEKGLRSLVIQDADSKETVLLTGRIKYTLNAQGLVKEIEYTKSYQEGVEDLFRGLQKKALEYASEEDVANERSSSQKYIIQILKKPVPLDEQNIPF